MTAGDLMTVNPASVSPEASVAEAWDLMRELDVRHLPVVKSGVLVGVLSDRDLARLSVVGELSVEALNALARELATPVVKVMTPDVIFVEPETDLSEVVGILVEAKVGALPVVHPDTRELLGIISYIDVLRVLQDRLEEE